MRAAIFFVMCVLLSYSVIGSPIMTNFTANNTWTVPEGVTILLVEAWGGGGAGGGRTSTGYTGGGGGGAFAASNITVTPGENLTVVVGGAVSGTTSDGSAGNPSLLKWQNTSIAVYADFGLGGTLSAFGAGGLATNCIGTITRNGGNGYYNSGAYAGGGGGAGTNEAGTSATSATGGAGGAELGGDGGTAPDNPSTDGNPGQNYGGGGSGIRRAGADRIGGGGAQGFLRITYTPPNNIPNVTLNFPNNDTTLSPDFPVLLNVTYKDGDNDPGTVFFINSSNDEILCTNTSVVHDSEIYCGISVYYGQEFKWYVNATDGYDNRQHGIWNFSIQPYSLSFSLSYPNSGCSEGDGCPTPGCTACTYCSIKFPYLPSSAWNCTGQTNAVSFFLINNDGNVPFAIEAKLNETLPNAVFKLGLTPDPFDITVKLINELYQNITNIIPSSGTEEIWGFGNSSGFVPRGNYSLNLSMRSA